MVYSVLKKGLPKFELVVSSMDARVCRAMFLLDNDLDLVSAEQAQGDTTTRTPIARHAFAPVVEHNYAADATNYHHVDVCATSLITPRPSIGKKMQKKLPTGAVPGTTANLSLHLLLRAEERHLSLKTCRKASITWS
jgi:hypothetical protein